MRGISFSPLLSAIRLLPLKRRLGLIVVLFLLVGAAALWYLHKTERRQTLAEATTSLNEAIRMRNLEALNRYIDFNALSLDMAKAILAAQGARKPEPARLRELSDEVQNTILASFRTQEPVQLEKKAAGEAGYPEGAQGAIQRELDKYKAGQRGEKPEDPGVIKTVDEARPSLLPRDFVWQLSDKPLSVQGSDGYMGVLSTTISHPQAGYETPLKLLVQGGRKGWIVVGVSNGQELISRHLAALDAWRQRVTEVFQAENKRRYGIMIRHFQVVSCKAFLAKNLGSQGDAPLVIALEGVNMGTLPLMSAGMACQLRKRDGGLLATVPLNMARAIEPGEAFSQRWQLELPLELPETQKLLAEKELACTTDISAVSLGNGRIIHIRPQDELKALLK